MELDNQWIIYEMEMICDNDDVSKKGPRKNEVRID